MNLLRSSGCKTKDKDRVMMVGNRNGLGFLQESESFPEDALIHSRYAFGPAPLPSQNQRKQGLAYQWILTVITKAEWKAELEIGSLYRKRLSLQGTYHCEAHQNLVLDIRFRTITESIDRSGCDVEWQGGITGYIDRAPPSSASMVVKRYHLDGGILQQWLQRRRTIRGPERFAERFR
ncbi:hypothetical protein BD779DRAFT_1483188 [Infundibulicybe gibba]|nr:hypothetical protein BD779DRAFT_1483188 [Infundibulicybe gibba]